MNQGKLEAKEQPGNPTVSYTQRFELNQRSNGESLRAMTEDEWAFWRHNGYVVIKDVITKVQAKETADFLWEFEEKDPNDRDSWYLDKLTKNDIRMTELKGTGMVEVYNNQKLWNNRQNERIHQIFADIWGREDLWVSIDRANLNFPITADHEYKGFIHWDIDTSLNPKPVNVQGVLALNDQTDPNMGGFQCVPQLYRSFDEWVATQSEDRDPFKPDVTGFDIEKVPLEAGDLLIWDSMQPHGIRPNLSDSPRLAQYIAMTPAQSQNESLREWRISSWRDRIIPEGYAFPGDPRNWEQTRYPRAELTDLGQRLLGLKHW